MKNHWLDKKLDKEIDAACENVFTNAEFKDTDLLVQLQLDDRLALKEQEFLDELDNTCAGIDENEKATVREILLKHKDDPVWLSEVLKDIAAPYYGASYVSQETLGNLTVNCGINLDIVDNFTITCGDGWPDLDAFYPDNLFIQNEKLDHLSTKLDTNSNDHSQYQVMQYQVMHTPVLPGTMTGTIHWDAECNWGWVFSISAGHADIRRFTKEDGKSKMLDGQLGENLSDQECMEKLANGELEMPWYDNVFYVGLNLATGTLDIHHNRGDAPNVVVSYEYKGVGQL